METSSDSYEIGFAAAIGWNKKTNTTDIPPWEYVQEILEQRLNTILQACQVNDYTLYLTEGKTFRYDIAKKRPYKGTRKDNKPWHYNNLTVYMRDVLNAKICTYLEADDVMAIDHVASNGQTILASRDKDTLQVPGMHYTWENGRQPSFGPELITKEGWLKLNAKRDDLKGTGLSFFYAQVLMGDKVDNIGGLPNCGPVQAYELLANKSSEQQYENVCAAYQRYYPENWKEELLEQGKLTWLVRRLNQNGMPITWELEMTE